MAYGVLSYPQLYHQDYKLIKNYREKYDALYYKVVEPHFSFVFPVENIDMQAFTREINEKSTGAKRFDFEIRCAVINKDAVKDYYHLLLVPDKGFSQTIKLHDKLYSGILFEHLRMDIDFIPHIAIANSKDRFLVKKWVDEWNNNPFCIKGSVDAITIVDFTDGILTDLEEIRLLK